MKQLSVLDTLFVTMDNGRFPMIGTGFLVFDPSTSPEPWTLSHLRAHLLRLLPVMPPLRRRLVEVPLGLAAPVWVEDPEFNIDDHLHALGVPAPGGDQELAALVNEIGSLPLDWRRPLWDLWFVDGLAEGNKAIIMRIHHCAIDGMGGVEMIFQMFSTEPDVEVVSVPEDSWQPEPVPSQAEMLFRSVPSLMSRPWRTVQAATGLGASIARGRIGALLKSDDAKPDPNASARLFSGPRLPFNEIPHGVPHKSTAWADIAMSDVRKIRELHGCTVNDVALALSAAALRQWLIDHDALPDGPITCGNPVNTRTVDDKGAFENKFAIISLKLPVEVEESIERLKIINHATTAAKESVKSSGTNAVESLFGILAPGFTELVVNGLIAGLGSKTPAPFNTLVTNVQGPPIPLYLAGAKLERMHIQMMQTNGMSLIIAVMTYAGRMFITTVGHRENTPDIWSIPEEMLKEVSRLLNAPASAEG
ncbi:wax ester/triacylglycerol synthase family O-acyltransferase [Mycobacterium sp.]|uniref:wax ester/triacylglycerol synthase family O-acyltransferase n=1 Tax=Mycobacterium sp. TaxID=1785 RepID=UPI003F9DE031